MRATAASMLFGVALAVPPVAGGAFRVWVHQATVQLGYDLSAQEKERSRLESLARQLEVELAAARSPDNLQRLGRELGLRPPAPHEVWSISAQGDLGPQGTR